MKKILAFFIFYLFTWPVLAFETPYTLPSGANLITNAKEATLSPFFWAPVTTAIVLQHDNWDKKISKHLREDRPLWDSVENTASASSNYRQSTTIYMMLSSLVINCANGPCWDIRGLTFISDYILNVGAISSRNIFRDNINRHRPLVGDKSFPSGHATAASARVTLGNLNVDRSSFSDTVKLGVKSAAWGLAFLTAYARIEGGDHYPSDVLAGIALGHWVSYFIKKSFYYGVGINTDVETVLIPSKQNYQINLAYRF